MVRENTKETVGQTEVSEANLGQQEEKRGRSSIAFPYLDFSKAAAVAKAIHDHVGTGACSTEQLAAWLDQSPKSSAFRYQLNVARMFGLIDGGDAPKLAELGRMLVDPKREREARAKAFLKVPLFNAIFEKFKVGVLPPVAALQLEMGALGVAAKQRTLARQVLERSADQTGYFEHGRDRLVMPGFAPSTGSQQKDEKTGGGGGDGGSGGPPKHPLVVGLFQSLPPDGTVWTMDDAVAWLEAAAVNLRLAYKFKGSVTITPKQPTHSD